MENNTDTARRSLTAAKAEAYAEQAERLGLAFTSDDMASAYIDGARDTLVRVRGMIKSVGRMGGLSPQQAEMLIDVTCILDA